MSNEPATFPPNTFRAMRAILGKTLKGTISELIKRKPHRKFEANYTPGALSLLETGKTTWIQNLFYFWPLILDLTEYYRGRGFDADDKGSHIYIPSDT